MKRDTLPFSYLTEILSYDYNDGILTWKIPPCRWIKAGAIAGSKDTKKHVYIHINGKLYAAHRLAWYMHYGKWPSGEIDHINGIRSDNRIINLRDVTRRQNAQNKNTHRNGRLPGCYLHTQSRKWHSQIQVGDKRISLGLYDTEIEAHMAYVKALELYGFKLVPEVDRECI